MKITRAHRDSHYTPLSNELLRDGRLSFRARGLLAYLLSQEDGWETNSASLTRHGREGRDAIRAALRELDVAGYLIRRRYRDDTGVWRSDWQVVDNPRPPGRFSSPGGDQAKHTVSAGRHQDWKTGVGKPGPIKKDQQERGGGTSPSAPPPLAEVLRLEVCEHGGAVGRCPSCRKAAR